MSLTIFGGEGDSAVFLTFTASRVSILKGCEMVEAAELADEMAGAGAARCVISSLGLLWATSGLLLALAIAAAALTAAMA